MKTPSAGLSGRAASVGVLRTRRAIIKYLLGPFRFSVNQAAPLTSPYTEGGAVGSLTVTDTGNKLSVSSGMLNYAPNGAPSEGDPGIWSAASVARLAGRTLLSSVTPSVSGKRQVIGFDVDRTSFLTEPCMSVENNNTFRAYDVNPRPILDPWVAGTTYQIAVVLRSTGALYFVRGGIFAQWTLLWISNTGTTTPLFVGFTNLDGTGTLDNFRVLDLGTYDARFATDYGLVTNRLTTPAAAATTTSTADAVIEYTLTYNAVSSTTVQFRYLDANNNWYLDIPGNGFINLWQVDAGVFTQRASVAHGVTSGNPMRVVLVQEGNVYKVYVSNALKLTYTDAGSKLTTQTTVKVVAVANPISELVCWPRTVTLPAGI